LITEVIAKIEATRFEAANDFGGGNSAAYSPGFRLP
jgi:hypothetical protein